MSDGHGPAVGVEFLVGNLEPAELDLGSSRSTPSAWAAKASWTSHMSMSAGANPARRSAVAMAKAGAMPMYSRSRACVADATTRASGSMPSSWAGANWPE